MITKVVYFSTYFHQKKSLTSVSLLGFISSSCQEDDVTAQCQSEAYLNEDQEHAHGESETTRGQGEIA